ncbi:hypothetical protein L210DRAFT_3306924, partial [Boletus edulis BED1]
IRRVILHVRDTIRTALNIFGVLREYPHRPSYDPDAYVEPDALTYKGRQVPAEPMFPAPVETPPLPPPWPFQNMSIYHLMKWRYTGSIMKSQHEVNRLVQEVLLADDFRAEDLSGFSMQTQNSILDAKSTGSSPSDGWREVDVNIKIPTRTPDLGTTGGSHRSFTISGLLYRPIMDVVKAAFSSPAAKHFHLFPFRRFWQHPVDGSEQRVFDELYTSDAWLKAHDDLQKQSNEPGCKLEKVIAAMMFSSDATMLASFGTAKAWPVYLHFGNVSKYIRVQPTSGACHHIAFIPS